MSQVQSPAARRHAVTFLSPNRKRSLGASACRAVFALASVSTLIGLGGCWDEGDDVVPVASSFSVGGNLTGLTTSGLVLADGSDTATPAAGATSFTFPTALATGSVYAVTVRTQPVGAVCVVNGGSGTVGSAGVSGVSVACTPAYTIGGSVVGLAATGLVIANGSDTVTVASSATGFTLPTAVAQGGSYMVTVQTQPTGEHCSLTNSTGTVAGANVTTVAVACAPLAHSVGGTITGLSSSGLVLANGSETLSPAPGASTFTFATQVAEGGAYAVSVEAQPTGETCSVGSGSGTMGTSDVGFVQITCAANAYHVGGTLAGLTAGGLILANGTDTVSPAANAAGFTFSRTVAFGGSYSVTVQQQPTGLTCSVAGTFPATIGAGDVTDVAVTCTMATTFTLLAGRQQHCASTPLDGTGAAANIVQGTGDIAFDAANNLYFISVVTNTVRKITPAGVVTTLAGSGSNGTSDGTGAAASFDFDNQYNAIAVDGAGTIFVLDGRGKIRRITQDGVVTTLYDLFLHPFAVLDASSGAVDIAVDAADNIYVSAVNDGPGSPDRIVRITPAGVATMFASNLGQPRAIAIDGSGNVFVATLTRGVVVVSPTGAISPVAGSTAVGYADGTGAAAIFQGLTHISVSAGGNLFVADQNSGGNPSQAPALRQITSAGVVTTPVVSSDFTFLTSKPVPAAAVVVPSSAGYAITVDGTGVVYAQINCAFERVGP